MQRTLFAMLVGLALPAMSFAQAPPAPVELCSLTCEIEAAAGQDLQAVRDALACECDCEGADECPALPAPPVELPL